MTALYLLEPPASAAWLPFSDARPVCELRAGVWLIRERWEAISDSETAAIFGPPHLEAFCEEGVPPVEPRRSVTGPAVIGHSTFAPSGVAPELGSGPARLVNEGQTAGWWVPAGYQWTGEAADWPAVELEGLWLHGAYDLVTALEHFLAADVADFTQERGEEIPDGCVVLGDPADVVLLGAALEPGTVLDVRSGGVVIEQGARVHSGSRLEGPLYVGPGAEILGDVVRASAIGPRCRVRGEVSHSVFLGFANKAHFGFVGHSVIGRWVNLGAGTTTSNLKNTYGPVRLRLPHGALETGRQFLGSLIGDHVKIAIGTQLETGSVIGVGAHLFGSMRSPKYVAPFAWGETGQRLSEEVFLRIAERVLPRRGVTPSEQVRAMLAAVYRHATAGAEGAGPGPATD